MRLFGKISKKKDFIKVEVPVLYFEEDGIYYANIPALDILGYGKSEKEAAESMQLMVEEFIKDADEDKILEKELLKMGWVKMPQNIKSPQLSDTISHNDYLKNIIDNKRVRTDRIGVNFPAFA
jgi:hypothetical protein